MARPSHQAGFLLDQGPFLAPDSVCQTCCLYPVPALVVAGNLTLPFACSRNTVNHRPLHQLHHCCGDPLCPAPATLDKAWCGPHLCPGLLALDRGWGPLKLSFLSSPAEPYLLTSGPYCRTHCRGKWVKGLQQPRENAVSRGKSGRGGSFDLLDLSKRGKGQ